MKKGYTLIETVVALSILTFALVGPVSLILTSLNKVYFSKNKLIAANLAQEGIELIRTIRENNVICEVRGTPGGRWDSDYDGTGNLKGTNRTADATAFETVPCVSGVTVKNPILGGSCSTNNLKLSSGGTYGYDAGGSNTIFSRCISIDNPAIDEGSIQKNNMLDITSTVTWTERGTNRQVELKDRLYNWK